MGSAQWRWAGPPVTLTGHMTTLVFERVGIPSGNATSRTIRIDARCVDCPATARLQFDATTPGRQYQRNPDVAEAVMARVDFPAEGTWTFAPIGLELDVRAPTSTRPPVVVLRGSVPLPANCGSNEIRTVIARFSQAFNAANPTDLAELLDQHVDFSMTGPPLPKFVTQQRDEVSGYARSRTAAGERIYPYLVYAATYRGSPVDVGVYFVRHAPDLPGPDGYQRAYAGSLLRCEDLRLLRFNAGPVGG